MVPSILISYLDKWRVGIILLAILAVIVLLSVSGILPSGSSPVTVCSTDSTIPATGPLMPGPEEKIIVFKDPAPSKQLFTGATGKPVTVLSLTNDTRTNRFFFRYELPQLQPIEQKGFAQVFFTRTVDTEWTKPEDGIIGTANAPIAYS